MNKPYDLADLGEKLKAAGLIEVEQAAENCYAALKDWLVESAALSSSPYDDLIVSFMSHVDRYVLPQIDKLDGKSG